MSIQKWEYQIWPVNIETGEVVDATFSEKRWGLVLHRLGQEGWELAAVVPHPTGLASFYFKRPTR